MTLTIATRIRSICLPLVVRTPAFGHGGGLNAAGCHNDRKNGGYHCHRIPSVHVATPRRPTASSIPKPSYSAPSPLLSRPLPAEADSRVETIQKLLLRLGYHPGPVTGRMSPTTQFAIMKFEEEEGMPIRGEASSAILDALISKLAD